MAGASARHPGRPGPTCLYAAALALLLSSCLPTAAADRLGHGGAGGDGGSGHATMQRCGTEVRPTEKPLTEEERARIARVFGVGMPRIRPKLIYHIIHYNGRVNLRTDNPYPDFNLPPGDEKLLRQQTRVASEAFTRSRTNISFAYGSTIWHNNEDWARNCPAMLIEIAKQVAVRRPGVINVFVCNTGYAGLNFGENLEFVAIHYTTLPGGPEAGYNMGMTLVHELGHWAGLPHVFEGGSCKVDGDGIRDTPIQSQPSTHCNPLKPPDSCPNQTGYDSSNNYMDYSPDACMSTFTRGQVDKMHAYLMSNRLNLVRASAFKPRPVQRGLLAMSLTSTSHHMQLPSLAERPAAAAASHQERSFRSWRAVSADLWAWLAGRPDGNSTAPQRCANRGQRPTRLGCI